MTEADPQLAPETTWPVLEAFLLSGLADDPERLAHAIERVADLTQSDERGRLRSRVNSWLKKFRYRFRVERARDGRLYATGGDTGGRQIRWPILAQVVEEPRVRNACGVLVRLREPDGTPLVVESEAGEVFNPGAWVTVTGALVGRMVEAGVVTAAPPPEPGRSGTASMPATGFVEGYLAADPPTTRGLVAWVDRAVSRVDDRRLAGLLVLGLRHAFPSPDHADLMLSELNQVLLPAGLFLQRDDDQLSLVEDRGQSSIFYAIR